jgi:hypothetical protein
MEADRRDQWDIQIEHRCRPQPRGNECSVVRKPRAIVGEPLQPDGEIRRDPAMVQKWKGFGQP